ncbi:MAG TPA: cupin domain-containing protein [Gaiellaceae bacterium]|nr:cupin domain-containing protein [Gaiellaceae bacterium]
MAASEPPSTSVEEAIVLRPGEGERLGTTFIKAARPELSLLEFEVAPGGGASLHYHRGQSDSFYVLEGEIEFTVGETTVLGTPGTYVLSPAGLVHGFRNVGTVPARVLNIHAPGGFAEYRRELAALHETGVEPDQAFYERHDIFDID